MSWMAVGRLVRERRLALGMTQAKLAAAADLTQEAISMIERGRRGRRIRLRTAKNLAQALGMSLDDLLSSSEPSSGSGESSSG